MINSADKPVEIQPVDSVTVQGGQVITICRQHLVNGQLAETKIERRADDSFHLTIDDPEHGGQCSDVSLAKLMERFHPDIAMQLSMALTAKDPTQAQLTGWFPNYKINQIPLL